VIRCSPDGFSGMGAICWSFAIGEVPTRHVQGTTATAGHTSMGRSAAPSALIGIGRIVQEFT
jgi:hypothetical protein